MRLAVRILRKDWERPLAKSLRLLLLSQGGATAIEAVNFLHRPKILHGQKFYELMRDSFPERSLRRKLQTFPLPPSDAVEQH